MRRHLRQHLLDRAGVSVAQAKDYSLYRSGDTLGSDEYPHTYHDYEGFDARTP